MDQTVLEAEIDCLGPPKAVTDVGSVRSSALQHPTMGPSVLPRVDRLHSAEARERPAGAVPIEGIASLGVPGTSWVLGRVAVLTALAGLARVHTHVLGGDRLAAVQLELVFLSGLVVLGVLASAWWAATLAGNARRLRLAVPGPAWVAAAWATPLLWMVIASILMRLEVRSEFDPRPGLVIIGFGVAAAVPYGVTSTVFRAYDRHRAPMGGWWSIFVLDVIGFGLAWNLMARRQMWSPPELPTAAENWWVWSVGIGAAGSLVAVLAAVSVAMRAPRLVRSRLHVLERRSDSPVTPAWFQTGFHPRTQSDDRDVALVPTAAFRWTAVGLHLLWAAVALSVAAVAAWTVLNGASGDRGLNVRLVVASTIGGAFPVVAHSIWSIVAATNARRRSVMVVRPSVQIALALPVPVAACAAVMVSGEARWAVITGGLVAMNLAFLVSLRVDRASAVDLGASAYSFRSWSICSAVAAMSGLLVWLLVGPDGTSELTSLTALVVIVHAVSVASAVWPARGAMTGFDKHLERPKHSDTLPRSRR